MYKGRCREEDTQKLLDMLDDVFFAEDSPETKRTFLSLLPKLYKDKYSPAYNNLIVENDGKIDAAVGLYPFRMNVLGKELRVGGIGNVAVARDARHKGYMIDCMNMCLDIMKNDGTDISLLGGHRQRYEHFGFEPMGSNFWFKINRRNIAHIKGRDYKSDFTVREVKAEDTDILKMIKSLYERSGVYADRPFENLYDILCSWRNRPYAVFDGEEFKGYFTREIYGGWGEFRPVSAEDTIDMVLSILDKFGEDEIDFDVPPYDEELCDYMSKYCDDTNCNHSEKTNILNYKNFISAFLGLKASHVNLSSGSVVLLIHGIRKDEQLKITVDGKTVTVEDTEEAPLLELEHLEAERFLGGVYSKRRYHLPDFAAGWFPVDFFCFGQDNV